MTMWAIFGVSVPTGVVGVHVGAVVCVVSGVRAHVVADRRPPAAGRGPARYAELNTRWDG